MNKLTDIIEVEAIMIAFVIATRQRHYRQCFYTQTRKDAFSKTAGNDHFGGEYEITTAMY
jgi:hypothetical protein